MNKKDKKYGELNKLFAAHKTTIPDNGFSQRVMQTLPDRSYASPLRYVVVTLCAIAVLMLVLLPNESFILSSLADLVKSVCTLSAPSPISLLTYVGLVGLLGLVGFAVYYES